MAISVITQYLSAIALGLVQGLTEFLPVSSSGHLVFAQHLLGIEGDQVGFFVILHLGSLLAVVIYFWKDLLSIYLAPIKQTAGLKERQYLWAIILACIPTAIIGLTFQEQFKEMFQHPRLDAIMLWITAIILVITDRVRVREKGDGRISYFQSLVIGTAQGISIIPGISRSGATIGAGVFTGLDRDSAIRFSFLLSIPVIIGGAALELHGAKGLAPFGVLPAILGTLVAFVAGYLAIDVLLKIVLKQRLWIFAVYLFLLGMVEILTS